MHTFHFHATPVSVVQMDGYTSTRFEMYAGGTQHGSVDVAKPGDLAEALSAWAHSTPLPEVVSRSGNVLLNNAWTVSVRKPARWPQGFKQAGERSHTFVVGPAMTENARGERVWATLDDVIDQATQEGLID